jgi:hypothetical protein
VEHLLRRIRRRLPHAEGLHVHARAHLGGRVLRRDQPARGRGHGPRRPHGTQREPAAGAQMSSRRQMDGQLTRSGGVGLYWQQLRR